MSERFTKEAYETGMKFMRKLYPPEKCPSAFFLYVCEQHAEELRESMGELPGNVIVLKEGDTVWARPQSIVVQSTVVL